MTALVRFLKGLLALLLLVAAVLWFAARRGDRGLIDQEITIARPSAAIFRWISSEDLLRRWISNLVELRKDEPAPPQNPSYRLVERIGGRKVAMRLDVVREVQNQELGLQFSSLDLTGGFSGEAQFKLIGGEEYTRLVFTSHAEFLSLADRIAEPVLTFLTDRKMKDDLARLRLLLEAEPASTPAPRTAPRGSKPVR